MDQTLLNKLIYPFTSHWDENYKRYYYFNVVSNESVWELPTE